RPRRARSSRCWPWRRCPARDPGRRPPGWRAGWASLRGSARSPPCRPTSGPGSSVPARRPARWPVSPGWPGWWWPAWPWRSGSSAVPTSVADAARGPGSAAPGGPGTTAPRGPGAGGARGFGHDGAGRSYCRIMRVPPWRDLGRPQRVDLAIACVLLAWGLPDVPWWWEPSGHAGSAPVVLGSLGLTLAMSVPFCWRRRYPALVLALAAGVLATRAALGRNEISAFAAVLIGAYGLGAYSAATRRYARWLGWAALAVALVTVTVNHIRLAAAPFALLGAAFVLGDAASARRAETAAAVAAAHQAERTRIARELHDVVAHQLSAIAVQAGAARIA